MSDSTAGTASSQAATEASTRGLPYYEKVRGELRESLQKKRIVDRNLSSLEESIYKLETAYLEETGAIGNIIKGFENYVKASSASATAAGGPTAARRKGGINDADRPFSRSSASFITVRDTGRHTGRAAPAHALSTGLFGSIFVPDDPRGSHAGSFSRSFQHG